MKEQVILSYTKGITRTPSDFLCEDGELAECVNLEVKGQELVPIEMPVDMGVTLGANEELVYVHNIGQSSRKNYITLTKSGSTSIIKAFYLNGTSKNYYSLSVSVEGFTAVASLGMTLVIYGSNAPTYVLFKELTYQVLGSELPEVSLSFNLTGKYRLEESSYNIEETGENQSPTRITGSTEIHQSHVNKFIAENGSNDGKFIYPFFVRYALRLYNGSYVKYSAPVLMLPSVLTSPSVHLLNSDYSGGLKSSDFVVGGYVADLQMKVNNVDDLSNWSDIVKGVSIFITRETFSYNQAYVDESEGKGNFLSESNWSNDDQTRGSVPCEHLGEITEADLLDGWTVVVNTLPEGYKKWKTTDIYNLLGSGVYAVPTFEKGQFLSDLLANSAVYYKYLDVNTSDLIGLSTDYVIVNERFNPYPINTIEQSEVLDLMGDYMSNDVLIPSFVNTYNSRLNIANIKRILYKGYSPDSLCQNLTPATPYHSYNVYVFIHSEGGEDIVVKSNNISDSNLDIYGAYLYYPDTDAYKMVIHDIEQNHYSSIPLAEDMYSNGSYYINLDGLSWISGDPGISETKINYELLPNKLFTSEVNNVFYFPLAGINTVGTGKILGISALTRPISQGQFGEYPLMAFCSDGNFALRVDSEGFYSGISPMQEDIILGHDKLTPLENSILAITKKGILITGASSDLTQIATQLEGRNFMSGSLSDITEGAASFSSLITNSTDVEGFREYLEGARMAYDYSSERIFIYNKSKNYCYVYLFRNGTISKLVMIGEHIITHVIDYPDSVIQTSSGKLYSLYEREDINELTDKRLGFAVTRPMKLGNPLSYKSIRQVKHMFYRESESSSVKCKIYGSNDNITYYLVPSKYGKPFKYYRIAFYTDLLPKEAFAGTALIIDERRNHKLR